MDPDEARWKIMKAMLDSFPSLRKRAIEYLKINESATGNGNKEC